MMMWLSVVVVFASGGDDVVVDMVELPMISGCYVKVITRRNVQPM